MLCCYGNQLQIDTDVNAGYARWDQAGTLSKSWLFRMKCWHRLRRFLHFSQMFAQTGVTVSVLPSDLISGCKKDFCKNFCVRLQSGLFPTSGNNNCSVKTLLRLLNPHLQLQKNAVYSFSPPDKNALVERRECDNSIWHILFLIKRF